MRKHFFIFLILIFSCLNSVFAQAANDQFSDLKVTLQKVYDSDQGGRVKLIALMQKGATNTPEFKDLAVSIKKTDEENLKIVTEILDKHGWLGSDEVGFQGSQALFLVIQHADLPVQEKYLPLVRKAAETGKTLPSNLAILEDRVLLREGKKQIYGSQVWVDTKTGNKYVQPLESPDNVDERRKKVGLNPIAEYLLQSFQMKWDVEEYKKQLPEIERLLSEVQKEKEKKN